jgi:hypothetical protein
MTGTHRKGDAMRPPSWGERTAYRAIRFIPESYALAPERALVNIACVLIGLSVLFVSHHSSESLVARWPFWLVLEWGIGMILGGLAAMIGITRADSPMTRTGQLLIALCCAFYAVDLVLTFGLRAVLTSVIFLSISGAKLIRICVSSAVRAGLLKKQQENDGHEDT